jgi:cytochrome P450
MLSMTVLQVTNAVLRDRRPTIIVYLIVASFSYWLLPFPHGLLFASTRKVPGPFWARWTRWFEFRAVPKGDSNLEYARLHERLGLSSSQQCNFSGIADSITVGPVVRVGPNRYSFNAPADVKVIYELGGKFTKSEFYEPLLAADPDERNIFCLRDPSVHKERRKYVSKLYSMSTMVFYEEAVNKMTTVCIRKLRQFVDRKQTIFLPDFMQYYAFDVIGEITVHFPSEFAKHQAECNVVQ